MEKQQKKLLNIDTSNLHFPSIQFDANKKDSEVTLTNSCYTAAR